MRLSLMTTFSTPQNSLLDRIDLRVNVLGPLASIANAGNNGQAVELYGCTYKIWNWGWEFLVFPEGWGFPSGIPTNTLWDLWLDGDESKGIRPYELVSKKGSDAKESITTNMSKAKTAMKCIIDHTGKSIYSAILALSIARKDELFARIFRELCVVLFPDKPAVYFESLNAQAFPPTKGCMILSVPRKDGGFRIEVCIS